MQLWPNICLAVGPLSGSDYELPVAYCRDQSNLTRWMSLNLARMQIASTISGLFSRRQIIKKELISATGARKVQLIDQFASIDSEIRRHVDRRNSIDTEIDVLTQYSYISISSKLVKSLSETKIMENFQSMHPRRMIWKKRGNENVLVKSDRNKIFAIKDGVQLQILMNLAADEHSITVPACEPADNVSSNLLIRQVHIAGYSEKTFAHWLPIIQSGPAPDMIHGISEFFGKLVNFHEDLDKIDMKIDKRVPDMLPLTFYTSQEPTN